MTDLTAITAHGNAPMDDEFEDGPDHDTIAEIAARELAALPAEFRSLVTNVAFLVQDFPDAEILADFDLDSPYDLLGLYSGIALPHASLLDMPSDIDRIFLYRQPLLTYVKETGEDLADTVRHVLIHEIGHHFGFSDEDMEAIEASG